MKIRSKTIKGIIVATVAVLLCFVMIFAFAACGEGAQGEKGDPGVNGAPGEKGDAGLTPHIGANGNWWIGDTDTGIYAGDAAKVPEEVEKIAETLAAQKQSVTGRPEAKGMFYTDYETLEDAYAASKEIVGQVASEGYVLLKNENNALPLGENERHVSLLGVANAFPQYGGGGSGAGYPGSYGIPFETVRDGVENGGFVVNPRLDHFYRANYEQSSLEPGPDVLKGVETTFYNYDSAAIITIKRTGSEGSDIAMSDVAGHADKSEHYLELDDNEKALIRYAKQHFPKVIVLINAGNIMEMGELNAPKTESNLGVDAILNIGHVGNNGTTALGAVLSGAVSPSGHTTDTWTYDFTQDPSYKNFGGMSQNGEDWINMLYDEAGAETSYYTIEYREDIYVGYRYYETKYADMNAAAEGSGDEWYDDTVLYPFGYGLSYTSFDWEMSPAVAENADITAANGTVTIDVKVTNTGSAAGKDVVQVYATPPYNFGGVEKAHVNLMGFAKTKLLQPGESQTVRVQFVAQDMASYDWQGLNDAGYKGYVLEAGDYTVTAKRDAHDEGLSVTRTVRDLITCETDYTTGREIEPLFSATEGKWSRYNTTVTPTGAFARNLMSRSADLDIPAAASVADRTVGQDFIDAAVDSVWEWSYEDNAEDYWYVGENGIPENWEQSDAAVEIQNRSAAYRGRRYIATRTDEATKKAPIQLKDMTGVPYEDYALEGGTIAVGEDEGSRKWEEFMNQLTWEEMLQIVSSGGYTRPEVDSIGKALETDPDGPAQLSTMLMFWSGFDNATEDNPYGGTRADAQLGASTLWPTGYLLACTWNTDLMYKVGRATGNEALFLHCNGWYGPAMNTHRSPFGGRNFEYYSEDGVLGGKIAAAIVRGATDKGIVTYLKHFALNEQETNRSGIFTYVTEQAMREIYLKPFELAIKEGGAMGTMNSMNRIGRVQGYTNGALHDGLLRSEWNFKGITLTDAWMDNARGNKHINDQLHNGVDLALAWSMFNNCGIEANYFDTDSQMVYVNPEGQRGNQGIITGTNADGVATAAYDMSTLTEASPTLWYAVRRAAMHILYVSANSSGNFNGFEGTTETHEFRLNADGRAEVAATVFKDHELSHVTVTDGALPAGVTIDANGVLRGTATQTGTFTVTIECLADGWIGTINEVTYNGVTRTLGSRVHATFTITIEPAA